jgi:hypothetical protein
MKIETDIAHINKSAKEVFDFLSNFKNYSKLMPPEISDWKATEEHCTFKKDKFVNIGMQFEHKVPNSEIKIVDYAKNAFPYSLTILIKEITATTTTTQMIFEGTPNAFLKLVVQKPLSVFFNNLNKSLKNI